MAALKIISVPQKYADSLAYQQLLDYIMRADKTPNSYIDGLCGAPQYAAEEMQTVSAIYGQNRGSWRATGSSALNEMNSRMLGTRINLRRWRADFTQIPTRSSMLSMRMLRTWHIHFVMNMISYLDGKRYAGKKKDFYDYQNYLQGVASVFSTYIMYVKDAER